MTKGELLDFLKPFTDEIPIDARMEYQVEDRSHFVTRAEYKIDHYGMGIIVLVVDKHTRHLQENK